MKKQETSRRSHQRTSGRIPDLAAGENALEDLAREDGRVDHNLVGELEQFREFKRLFVGMAAEESLQTIRGLACTVTADLDLRAVVMRILETGVRAAGAERGILFLGRGTDVGLVPVLAVNIEGEELQALTRVSRTILRRGQSGQHFVTPNALLEPDLKEIDSVQRNQVRSVLCLPLQSRSGPVGALYLDASAANVFGPDAVRLLGVLADVAATVLENAKVLGDLVRENALLRRAQESPVPTARLVGSGEKMVGLRQRAEVTAQMDAPYVLTGGPGSGRRLLSRVIHDGGARALGPFVVCDCAAVPADLLQGYLFGRTGAAASRVQPESAGLIQGVDHGTFVIESAELLGKELGQQFARILDHGTYRPMGGRKDERIDFRLVLITNHDLRLEVKRGRFSDDLYRRVSGLSVAIPPLRERLADIPELVAHFAWLHKDDHPGGAPVLFSPEALRYLERQPWPGNVGELELVVRRALRFTQRSAIRALHVRQALLLLEEDMTSSQGPWSGKVLTLAEWEKEAIRQALVHCGQNKSKVASLLGVHRNTLVRKIREMGL